MSERLTNKSQRLLHIDSDSARRETECPDAAYTHPFVAFIVLASMEEMDQAIDFNHEPRLVTVEVGDERAERVLAAELQAIKTACAKMIPEDCFGRG